MRLFFVGYMWPGSSCVPRLNGFLSQELEVEAFDATGWAGCGGRVSNVLAHRLYATPSVWAKNQALVASVVNFKPDVLWLEKGDWVYPSTLKRLRDHARFLIHYNTDDVFGAGSWFWLHRAGIQYYDLHLTTNRWNVQELRDRYGVRTIRAGMGYDQDFHRPVSQENRCTDRVDVVFIGHWEPHTESYLTALRDSGVTVAVWGHNWWRARDRSLRGVKPLNHGEYVHKVASAKMALCSLSRRNRNESTGRSFEIPAIGSCLLAERTLEHEYLYGDGLCAALFTGEEELVEKTHYYLDHEEDRREVAARGHARCLSLGLSWGDHVHREWAIVTQILGVGDETLDPEKDRPFWAGFRDGRPWEGALH